MIPSRSRLEGWTFDSLLSGAAVVESKGTAIESAGSGIETRCNDLPAVKAWDGDAHASASRAYGRAKSKAVVVGELAEGLGSALTQGYWSMTSAKSKAMGKVAEIEADSFLVGDHWVVTIKPIELTPEEARKLVDRRIQLQGELNPLVSAVGAADRAVADSVQTAATAQGFTAGKPSVAEMLMGGAPPSDELPDPMLMQGMMYQRAIADADAAVTVASKQPGMNDKGEPTTAVHMQDGSKKVFTESTTYGGSWRERPMTVEETFDPDGALVSTTTSFEQDNGTTVTGIKYADQTFVQIFSHPNGYRSATVYPPGGDPQEIPADSEFFTHPALTTAGGIISGTEASTGNALQKSLPTLTKNTVEDLHYGAKYGGLALASGVALYDVVTADSGGDACRAAIAGLGSVAGGWGAGAAGAAIPIPGVNVVAAGVLGAGGAWALGWVGSEIGKAVCY